jgi:hypothetical protein
LKNQLRFSFPRCKQRFASFRSELPHDFNAPLLDELQSSNEAKKCGFPFAAFPGNGEPIATPKAQV